MRDGLESASESIRSQTDNRRSWIEQLLLASKEFGMRELVELCIARLCIADVLALEPSIALAYKHDLSSLMVSAWLLLLTSLGPVALCEPSTRRAAMR